MKIGRTIILPGIAIIIVFLAAVAYIFFGATFSGEITRCHSVDKTLRFSCYRAVIEKYYKHDPTGFSKKIKTDRVFSSSLKNKSSDSSYAIFGTNCHTFYHAAGDFLATSFPEKDVAGLLNLCNGECTSGCTMGLYKRVALMKKFDDTTLQEFYRVCKEGEGHQCAHEIGHVLNDKYFYSILKVLDDMTFTHYGLKPDPKNQYTTFATVDFNAPFEDCKRLVPASELAYCLTGIGHNLFLFSQFSGNGYASMFSECDKIKEENRNDCYAFLIYRIGINEAAPKFLSNQSAEGVKVCNRATALIHRDDLKEHCYLGVGGGIGLFVDTEYGSRKMTDDIRPRIQKELLEYARLCEKVDAQYGNKCLAGLMGTRFKLLYNFLHLRYDRIEKILPELDTGFEVVG